MARLRSLRGRAIKSLILSVLFTTFLEDSLAFASGEQRKRVCNYLHTKIISGFVVLPLRMMIYSFSSALSLRAVMSACGRAWLGGREWKESRDDDFHPRSFFYCTFSRYFVPSPHCLAIKNGSRPAQMMKH